ncbi:quinone-dependent dihydroorotate dehydrogenase [Sphingomicrobium sediminis]|uniref:Dihydroorotate dehydrogenase (quinone) n=1 Tax=Sphingomicrobium sediminis TaxID=2950949 RepID=A0A9X2EI10_9SPHN|nr:quinone-dependent dihydroorotate dehydrogenase [Sphingomicrobium sediminis]MCM8557915.1 quinone-dependent dihydroorotate dehydrogenase [Sphingomicrobium sediminis]
MIYRLFRPLVFALRAEDAHRTTIAALKRMPRKPVPQFAPSLGQEIAGIHFPSPVGLAAGFDKDAEVPSAMLGLGFGFVEVGTLTPRPQAGNPKPRLFRLKEDHAVINRMGFNNGGQLKAAERLQMRVRERGVVGINIGANKDSEDRIADYVLGVQRMGGLADYLTVNISSPNTPGLRQLQDEGALKELLQAVREARGDAGPPVFLKVAPDLEADDPERISRVAIDSGIDALIVSNTTIDRPDTLQSPLASETGGLSGRPLKDKALAALRGFRKASGGDIPLIAAGGIENANDVWVRMRAGASLVQLYSALVYEGPGLAMQIAAGLSRRLEAEGVSNIAEIVGTE